MIKLDQFLKFVGITSTGGQAKLMIVGGEVKVNGVVETRRGRKLVEDDEVTVAGQSLKVGEVISEDVLKVDDSVSNIDILPNSYSPRIGDNS